MILLEKQKTTTIPFYLTPLKANPIYTFKFVNKTSLHTDYAFVNNVSPNDVYQLFNFNLIVQQLDIGTYNYYIYEVDELVIPNETANVLEVGLMLVINDECNVNVSYKPTSNNIVYYDCGE